MPGANSHWPATVKPEQLKAVLAGKTTRLGVFPELQVIPVRAGANAQAMAGANIVISAKLLTAKAEGDLKDKIGAGWSGFGPVFIHGDAPEAALLEALAASPHVEAEKLHALVKVLLVGPMGVATVASDDDDDESSSGAAAAGLAAWQDDLPQRADLEKALDSPDPGKMQKLELGKAPVLTLNLMIAPPVDAFLQSVDNDTDPLHEPMEKAFHESALICAPDSTSDSQEEALSDEDAEVVLYEDPESATDIVIGALSQLADVAARKETASATVIFIRCSEAELEDKKQKARLKALKLKELSEVEARMASAKAASDAALAKAAALSAAAAATVAMQLAFAPDAIAAHLKDQLAKTMSPELKVVLKVHLEHNAQIQAKKAVAEKLPPPASAPQAPPAAVQAQSNIQASQQQAQKIVDSSQAKQAQDTAKQAQDSISQVQNKATAAASGNVAPPNVNPSVPTQNAQNATQQLLGNSNVSGHQEMLSNTTQKLSEIQTKVTANGS